MNTNRNRSYPSGYQKRDSKKKKESDAVKNTKPITSYYSGGDGPRSEFGVGDPSQSSTQSASLVYCPDDQPPDSPAISSMSLPQQNIPNPVAVTVPQFENISQTPESSSFECETQDTATRQSEQDSD
jgi:hypothetical protein